MTNILLALIITFVVGLALIPPVFWLVDKAKAKQTILKYVTTHKNKQGTRTLGGLIFVLSSCAVAPFFFSGQARLAGITIAVFCSFALLGFLDDFIKIRTHKDKITFCFKMIYFFHKKYKIIYKKLSLYN